MIDMVDICDKLLFDGLLFERGNKMIKPQGKMEAGDIIWCGGYISAVPEYKHYGVYIGNSQVIHYAPEDATVNIIADSAKAVIHCVSMNKFLNGKPPFIDNDFKPLKFNPTQIIERAREKIGTNMGEFHIFSHNCEHFASWCKTGRPRSKQVEFDAGSVKFAGKAYKYIMANQTIITKIGGTIIAVAPKAKLRGISVLKIFTDLLTGTFKKKEYF